MFKFILLAFFGGFVLLALWGKRIEKKNIEKFSSREAWQEHEAEQRYLKQRESESSSTIVETPRKINKSENYYQNPYDQYNTPAIERHFELIQLISEYYQLGDYAKCIKYCLEDIEQFPQFKEDYSRQQTEYLRMDEPQLPQMVSFETLAKVYDKQERYGAAIAICNQAIEYGLDDGTKGGFDGRKKRLEKKMSSGSALTGPTAQKVQLVDAQMLAIAKNEIVFADEWKISVSFGKSTSQNFVKAIFLAKSAPEYHELDVEGKTVYQAVFTQEPESFLKFVELYELVRGWKSSFAMINGDLIDRKIISGINYCYGDKCRSGREDFCFGASFMTENPFGCHRLQISAENHPWWSFIVKVGNIYHVDKEAIRKRAKEYGYPYRLCPSYDQNRIDAAIDALPDTLSIRDYTLIQKDEGEARVLMEYERRIKQKLLQK